MFHLVRCEDTLEPAEALRGTADCAIAEYLASKTEGGYTARMH